MKTSVFVDSDVLLDLLTDRKPFVEDAVKLMELTAEKELIAATTPLVIANMYYILRKNFSHHEILSIFKELLSLIDIISMNKMTVLDAMNSNFTDFEDALQNSSLKNTEIKTIITRNINDYKNSEFAVLTPNEFLESLS